MPNTENPETPVFRAMMGGMPVFLANNSMGDWAVFENDPEDYRPVELLAAYQGHAAFFPAMVRNIFGIDAFLAVTGSTRTAPTGPNTVDS